MAAYKACTEALRQAAATKDLDLVLEWRNRPDVRRNMYTKHEISRDEHHKWFARTKADATKKYLLCVGDDKPVGVVGFYDIKAGHKTADWAFYSGDPTKRRYRIANPISNAPKMIDAAAASLSAYFLNAVLYT